jgi:hypothetical protein
MAYMKGGVKMSKVFAISKGKLILDSGAPFSFTIVPEHLLGSSGKLSDGEFDLLSLSKAMAEDLWHELPDGSLENESFEGFISKIDERLVLSACFERHEK